MRCRVLCGTSSEDVAQVFTGLALLKLAGLVDVKFARLDVATNREIPSGLRVDLDDDLRLAFDMGDSPSISEKTMRNCDVYVKRSFLRSAVDACSRPERVIHFGLNYAVYGSDAWYLRRASSSLRARRVTGNRTALVRTVRLLRPFSALANDRHGRAACTVEAFEAPPLCSDEPKAFSFTRVWDPTLVADKNPAQAEHWHATNEIRIGCIRILRKELGPRFFGGVSASLGALRDYPDCVVDPSPVKARSRYLRAVKQHDIGVVYAGLWRSNGWRLGEFVAASRAIVSEPLAHEVPGDFNDSNYSSFATPEECLTQCSALLDDHERRAAMMQANFDYYHRYVRPDALVLNVLDAAKQAVTRGS